MTTTTISTRRSFIRTAGAALSVPLTAAAPIALAGAGREGNELKERLAMLEDVNAVRALNQAYARHVNAAAHEEIAGLFADPSDAPVDRGVRGVTADRFGENDVIEVAADRATAAASLHCLVETESIIGPTCPPVEMARAQGGGVVRSSERGVFENLYVRRERIWKIHRSTWRPATPEAV